MDSLAVATLARAMAEAIDLYALSRCFLAELVAAHPLASACCYRRSLAEDRLVPVACTQISTDALPLLDLDELENPLVYASRSAKPCFVEDVTRLVDVGAGFDALRESWSAAPALLVVPLKSAGKSVSGVAALLGTAASLTSWRQSPLWQLLLAAYESLFSRLGDMADAEESIRYETSVRRTLERDRSKSLAKRLATEFIGNSEAARHIREEMLRLGESSLSVLITGETGSGKDHAAWLIHQASPREGPFVPVNCAAIPKDLIEAELFGSTRGAYTGATQARAGLVAEAHGGTLFLDEIGDMPMAMQGTLLRVLNEKKYRPVGATKERESNFRLICATHQPLPQRIREGLFREDLHFRIRQRWLHLPPLRERPEDISALATHVLLQYNRDHGLHIGGFSAAAASWLGQQSFPGNVRELRSLVLAAAERTRTGKTIAMETLQALTSDEDTGAHQGDDGLQQLMSLDSLPDAVETFERTMVSQRLRQLNGSRSRTAQSLGIPKRTLAYKCRKWKLDRDMDFP
ncbi:sigma 54-interacting transcriptional regulator [Dyella kyungheensis]|uniref:Sigma-54-dependent Fis family transcriptional regulator n=1 Tax=Dyella kyungheensis TaxID=1242174 RepID=A0ABS2JWE3_9GAMM|nr:sigma-54 dependent transcriptional regulator [Dyella kyungheensis]MBM7123326.1 sigma-54-dependent Fis family transcriptional regulator [Dyella kyungheensis]